MARAFAEACIAAGWAVHPEPRAAPSAKVIPSKWKVASGRQPRGRRAPQLLPEDGQVVQVQVSTKADLLTVQQWSGRSVHISGRIFPKRVPNDPFSAGR